VLWHPGRDNQLAKVATASSTTTLPSDQTGRASPQPDQSPPAAPDPRTTWNAPDLLKSIQADLRTLKATYAATPPEASAAAIDSLARQVADLDPQKQPWNRDNQPAIAQAVPRVLADLGAQSASLKKLLTDEAEYAVWAKDVQSRTEPFASPSLNKQWVRLRDGLLSANTDKASRRRDVAQLQAVLGRIENAFPAPSPIDDQGQAWARIITGKLDQQHRDEAISSACDLIKLASSGALAPTDADLARISAAYAQWRKDAAALIQSQSRIASLLDAFHTLDDADDNSLSAAITAAAPADALLKEPAIAAELAPPRQRVGELTEIHSLKDRSRLLTFDAKSPQATWAAWRRLAAVGQQEFSDLAAESKLAKSAQQALDRLPDAQRRQSLQQQLLREQQALWQANYALAAGPRQIETALDCMADFTVSEQSLAPAVKYNLLLRASKKRAASPLNDTAARAVADSLAADAARLDAAVAQSPQVTELLKGLQAIPKSDVSSSPLAGPAVAAHWDRQPTADGERFTWTGKTGQKHTLDFVRIETPQGVSFLCTTELPLGVLIDTVDALGDWRAFSTLLKAPNDRRGLYVWEWKDPSDPAKGMKAASEWVAPDYYNPQLKIASNKPSQDHPMQQINAPAAIYVARLLGCRLPASAEWAEAYRRQSASAAPGAYNLRDRTWDEQFKYSKQRRASGQQLPAEIENVFGVLDTQISQEIENPAVWSKSLTPGRAAAAERYDDGVLWFRAVGEDTASPFKDLVGNVAELVCDDPGLWPLLAAAPVDSLNRTLNQRLAAQGPKLCVIGGSALSSSMQPFDRPQPFSDRLDWQRGFADIGLRLSYTAPPVPAAEPLRGILEKAAYLPPK
jgi:hypothetical protein